MELKQKQQKKTTMIKLEMICVCVCVCVCIYFYVYDIVFNYSNIFFYFFPSKRSMKSKLARKTNHYKKEQFNQFIFPTHTTHSFFTSNFIILFNNKINTPIIIIQEMLYGSDCRHNTAHHITTAQHLSVL